VNFRQGKAGAVAVAEGDGKRLYAIDLAESVLKGVACSARLCKKQFPFQPSNISCDHKSGVACTDK
jgi:hypothetical protein